MAIVFTFVLNALLNLVLGLAVAGVLGLEEYGRFAVASVVTFTLAGAGFEWLRLATTRFYGEAARAGEPAVRATLDLAYLGLTTAIVLIALAILAFHLNTGLAPPLAAAACIAGAASGLFEYKAALARARFLNRTYTILVIVKNIMTLTLMVAAGYFLKEAVWVLAALTLAVAISLAPVERVLRDDAAKPALFDAARLTTFARYGLPIVAGNVVYQLILLANRSFAASAFGYAASGKLSLATDLSLRLFVSVGAALDVLLFQMAVQAEVRGGRTAAHAQIARNMLIILAVLVPMAIGYMVNLGPLESLVVPERFQGDFAALNLVLVPGIFLFCLGQFVFSPVFQLQHKTLPLVLAAILSLGIDAAGLALVPVSAGLDGIAMVHAASLGAGCIFTAALAWRWRDCFPPVRDVAGIFAAALLMLAAVWPLHAIASPLLSLAASGFLGAMVYVSALLVLDIAACRQWVAVKWMETAGNGRKPVQAKDARR